MSLKTTHEEPELNLSQARPIEDSPKSFQADILKIQSAPRIAKIYRPMTFFGLVRLDDPIYREEVLRRELTCLSFLASPLDPRIEMVRDHKGKRTTAITMNVIPQEDFFDAWVQRGEIPSDNLIRNLTDRLANFHFSSAVSDPSGNFLNSLPLSGRLIDQLQTQVEAIRTIKSGVIQEGSPLQNLFQIGIDAVKQHQQQIDRYAKVFEEPVIGHGDIKTQNIAFTGGEALVLDSAPYPLWRIQTRRSDLLLLVCELELMGFEELGAKILRFYSESLKERGKERGLNRDPRESQEFFLTGELLDDLARLYRNSIFYTLSLIGVNPELEAKAIEQMAKCGEKLSLLGR